jgi:GNAT superfamily N-acetyltransferase
MPVSSSRCVRTLKEADIPSALELSTAAGWNQTADDWRMLITLAPDTCFALEAGNVIAATTSLLIYEDKLAWLGMVLTRLQYQRRGYARLLVEHALEEADRRGVRTVKLDATAQGAQLYRKLGFHPEQNVERWVGDGEKSGNGNGRERSPNATEIAKLDREIYGVDRSPLIRQLLKRSQVTASSDGIAMRRAGVRANYLGPCAARDADTARGLILASLHTHPGLWFWDILPANKCAVDLASELGFHAERHLIRMSRGAHLTTDHVRVFAIAGFEIG